MILEQYSFFNYTFHLNYHNYKFIFFLYYLCFGMDWLPTTHTLQRTLHARSLWDHDTTCTRLKVNNQSGHGICSENPSRKEPLGPCTRPMVDNQSSCGLNPPQTICSKFSLKGLQLSIQISCPGEGIRFRSLHLHYKYQLIVKESGMFISPV